MDAGLGFGDGAVVDLDLGWLALDEDALDGLAAGGNQQALGDRGRGGADGYGNFGGGVAAIGYVNGDQPVARRGGAGKDARDGQVGQALVGIDPVGEEPGEIAARSGIFEETFEGAAGGAGGGGRGASGRVSRNASRRD